MKDKLRFAHDIVDGATNSQIRRWYAEICEGRWPKRMPVPHEALEAVWAKLHARAINLPAKRGK